MESVNSGEVAADMLRPMSCLRLRMASDLGHATVNLLLRQDGHHFADLRPLC